MAEIRLTVNGRERSLSADPAMPLLWALRDLLGLTGTKYGCGSGLCGSCTVHLDGRAVRSCITSLAEVGNKQIVTIEGLSSELSHPLQKAWLDENVSQCGYCQPGQLMSAAALLAQNPTPTDNEISSVMSGVICRCGTYQRIRKAIHRAVEEG